MRAGICSIQVQALTPEAATVVKQAVALARRRGHAQITPLHVASAMLATSTGLLRRACLHCHSHPLQCKALELCFNVALNRLPSSTSSPLLGPQYSSPFLSNALIASFKRAQAHQRRGSIENQQQPILVLKIEVEQLIISILDDPSVSRVMREAGFSSTHVKIRVEQVVSLEASSKSPSVTASIIPSKDSVEPQVLANNMSPSTSDFIQFGGSILQTSYSDNMNDDVTSLLNDLSKRRRNIVVVGECELSAERITKGIVEKFEGGNVPADLRHVQFISVPLVTLKNMSMEEIEQKIADLRYLIKSYAGRDVVLYLGDMKWLFELWLNYCQQKRPSSCSVENIVVQLQKLVGEAEEAGKLCLMGITTFQTYMRCKSCHPSLESILELHPFTVPVGSLSLSQNIGSDMRVEEKSKVSRDSSVWQLLENPTGVHKLHTCCTDCSLNSEKGAKSFTCFFHKNSVVSASSSLPTWLQNCKEDIKTITSDYQVSASLNDPCRQRNLFCSSMHRNSFTDKTLKISPTSPSTSASVSSHESKPDRLQHSRPSWPPVSEPNEIEKECGFWEASSKGCEKSLTIFMPERNVPKPDLMSNPNSSPNSASSSEAVEGLESIHMFNEVNDENMKILCDTLERKVPCESYTIPEIADTVLHCRSGVMKKQNKSVIKRSETRQETWMCFSGSDPQAKENISRELAKVVFGSYNNFFSIGVRSFSSSRATNSGDESRNKRARKELGCSYLQRLGEAANENPHRVFFIQDVELVDYSSQVGIMRAIGSGNITLDDGETVPLKDAIVVFSSESFSYVPKPPSFSPREEQLMNENHDLVNNGQYLPLDLNIDMEDDHERESLSTGYNNILQMVDKHIVFDRKKVINLT